MFRIPTLLKTPTYITKPSYLTILRPMCSLGTQICSAMQLFYFSLVQELDRKSHNAILKMTAIASTKFKPSRRYAIVVHFRNASTLRALVSSGARTPKRAGYDPVKILIEDKCPCSCMWWYQNLSSRDRLIAKTLSYL